MSINNETLEEGISMKRVIAQQGEIAIYKLDAMPQYDSRPFESRPDGKTIISHSENGNHHVLTGGDVLERVETPSGLQIFWTAIENAERLEQEAGNPHEAVDLDPGIYEFRISREYDPFADEIRRVAD